MQFKILEFYKKIIAMLMAFLASMGLTCGGNEPVDEIIRGEVNKAVAYDTDNADYSLSIDATDEMYDISDLLFGVFLEDINFAADGGLYAEKVINRSFEYFDQAKDGKLHGWSAVEGADLEIKNTDGLNANNENYLVITNNGDTKAGVQNRGFLDGMSCKKEKYNFSVYLKAVDGYDGAVTVRLTAGGNVAAEGEIKAIGEQWTKYELSFTSSLEADTDVYLQVLCEKGSVAVDMVSLFPEYL
ncbi:MAG: carbohydrate binding domain-containing protein [Acutalibacteraceae bacterium]